MHLKVDGFLWEQCAFSPRIIEKIMNPAAYNVTMTEYVVAVDPMPLVFLPVLII